MALKEASSNAKEVHPYRGRYPLECSLLQEALAKYQDRLTSQVAENAEQSDLIRKLQEADARQRQEIEQLRRELHRAMEGLIGG